MPVPLADLTADVIADGLKSTERPTPVRCRASDANWASAHEFAERVCQSLSAAIDEVPNG